MNNSTALKLTRELLRFNTINPPGQERACAEHLGRLLEAQGFSCAYHEFGEGRTSLIARIGGNASKRPICFTGHIDIVPLGNAAWSKDPFAGETASGKVYGRGSSDMKSGVAAFVLAAAALAKKLANGPGLVMVITAGEETGCQGAEYLETLHRKTGVLGQAGAIVVGEPTGNYPYVGHKGAYWLKAKTHGVTAHGSMPELGVNAIYKAARVIGKLENYDFAEPQHFMMGKPSLNVGTVAGGLNVNSVPDETTIGIDMRTIPNQDHARLKQNLQKHLGPDVELTVINDVAAVWTEPSHAWVQSVFEVMTKYLPEKPQPRTASYFTDAGALRKAWGAPPTLILGPGEPAMAHQTDEYCVVEKLERAVAAYTDIMVQWCGV
jgi:succinyl-diaminopimelate desuccinylase